MEVFTFSKKGQRQLTDFLAHELLYDYATHQLDAEREEAVRLAINQNPNLAKELEDIIYGLTYCKHLSQTQTKTTFIQKMKQPFSLWRTLEKKLNIRTWNPGLQWMGEAVVITVSLLLISFFIPWESIVFNFIAQNNEKIILSTVNKKNPGPQPLPPDKGREIAQTNNDQEYKPEVLRKYILKVANPQFTYNKLPAILPKFNASLIDQVLVPVGQDTIPQITLSIPQDRAEALIKELETHGKLTLSRTSGENEKEKEIWTLQIELEKEVK
jgi:hypothetical protein